MPDLVDPSLHPERNERRQCAFCSYTGPLSSREHIWPAAYAALIPNFEKVQYERGTTAHPEKRLTWEAAPFTTQMRMDCGKCNHERLRDIEADAAVPIALLARHLFEGSLSLDVQRRVAALVFRVFAVSQYMSDLRPIPRHQREHLIVHRSPPAKAEIWLWLYGGSDIASPKIHGAPGKAMWPGEAVPAWFNSYRAIWRLGHLVAEVAARRDDRGYPLVPADTDAYVRIWPIEFDRLVIWPPSKVLDDKGWQRKVGELNASITL